MTQQQSPKRKTSQPKTKNAVKAQLNNSSYAPLLEKFKGLALSAAGVPIDNVYNAFMRAGYGMENLAPLQNKRVKALNPLPADYTKQDLNEFLRTPSGSESSLRQIAEGLRWTAYPFQKIAKSYADMLTFRHYEFPSYIEEETVNSPQFKREWRLVVSLLKAVNLKNIGRTITHQALIQGKVFYTLRAIVDKVHNKVNTVFLQQLPSQYTQIIGFNNISKYTVSFDMMYFLQPGTDYTQYGDLFEPFINDFAGIFEAPKQKPDPKYIYAAQNSNKARVGNITINGETKYIYLDKVNERGEGQPRVFMQNGRWCYFVSLPIDKVWTFEIDSSTAIVASIFSGLFQTLSQQADYEAAQLSLIMNPLIKIFTGEIPYNDNDGATAEDSFKLSVGGRAMFEAFWNNLMALTNTGGTAFYTAPVENIKSHDYGEAANANKISSEFLNYEMSQTGLTALVPATDSPHQGVAEYSGKLEQEFATHIYDILKNMLEHYMQKSLNLKYDWQVNIFGSVYSDDITRANALKQLDKGDLSQQFILAALDDVSVLDRLSMSNLIISSGLINKLIPPATSYTMSKSATTVGEHSSGTSAAGAPSKTETEVKETKIEKKAGQTE